MTQYRKRALPVFALPITEGLPSTFMALSAHGISAEMDIRGEHTYVKWGGEQICKEGDFLLVNNGEAYTCEEQVFLDTYQAVGPNQYIKTALIEASEASEAGTVTTLEGVSAYDAGDFVVTNPGGDRYCISRDKFLGMYEAV